MYASSPSSSFAAVHTTHSLRPRFRLCNYIRPTRIRCCSDSARKPRGFGPPQPPPIKDYKKNKVTSVRDGKDAVLPQRKPVIQQSGSVPSRAPRLGSQSDEKLKSSGSDLQFEERLEAIKRSALEQKKAEEKNEYGAIDYDSPLESEGSTIGLGTKIGAGIAVLVFGLVFAPGDFLPSGSMSPTEEVAAVRRDISLEEKVNLQKRLEQYEAKLRSSPDDSTALEGAAVTLTELGDYTRAASLLEDFTKKNPTNPDAFSLLGEIKYELKDYEGSVAAYRSSAKASGNIDFEVLRGITNALLAAKKPDEAVQVLLTFRGHFNTGELSSSTAGAMKEKSQVDPIQVELLLGKAYADWGHVSDAVSVYDQLISSHRDDFRGYLAKGILLKENGKVGDAERMFIQARFFAPEKAKALVDRYSR